MENNLQKNTQICQKVIVLIIVVILSIIGFLGGYNIAEKFTAPQEYYYHDQDGSNDEHQASVLCHKMFFENFPLEDGQDIKFKNRKVIRANQNLWKVYIKIEIEKDKTKSQKNIMCSVFKKKGVMYSNTKYLNID